MPTVNHVVIPNHTPTSPTTGQLFNNVWKLTRAMKKAGWKVLASTDGVTKTVNSDPVLDAWNGTTVTTNAGGVASLTIATPANGRALVSGLTGITSSDKGRFLVISGSGNAANNHAHQIEEVISGTSVKVDSRTFTLVAETSSLTWSITDPSQQLYSTAPANVIANTSWILMRGPSIMKIPITSAPVAGTATGKVFAAGENIVQATTGAEGEILGYEFDSGTGYLVVRPRVRGSGGNPFGWATGNVITGAATDSTVTQVGTAVEYRREIVFWKSTTEVTGTILNTYADPVGESGHLFSSLTGAAGCTATVAPGGGGTGNAFPTLASVAHGSDSSGTGHTEWDMVIAGRSTGNAQIMCADALAEQNYSADGSFLLLWASVANISAGGTGGFGLQVLDDTEPGDVDPWVFYHYRFDTLYNNNRTSASAAPLNGSQIQEFQVSTYAATSYSFFTGWRRRGLASGDQFQEYEPAWMGNLQTAPGNVSWLGATLGTTAKLASGAVATKVREPMRLVTTQSARKSSKGTLRWMYLVQNTGGWGDTYDSKRFVQMSNLATPFIVGPWDGSSTPAFQNV